MGRIVMGMSMSLDGFIAAKNDSPDQPLGEDGDLLHDWYFRNNAKEYNDTVAEGEANVGAVIIGRRTYENSSAWGGDKGPLGSVPCIILSSAEHVPPKEDIDPVFTFDSDGIESALARAREIAGDKDIAVMGANVQQQFIAAGLIDVISISVVPALLCEGVRLFDHLGSKHISLEQTEVGPGDQVAHLNYIVKK